MKGTTILKILNLSKKYSIGSISFNTFREDFSEFVRKFFFREKKFFFNKNNFYAIKNINLEVKKGEGVALIGDNGSGKTTLLKCISRVATPTEGKIIISGKVCSLFSIITSINPELTGKENIYFIAAMYGFQKKDIIKIIDRIINFSEIHQYINTPMKRYSSGMNTRLVLSTVLFLNIDIFVVDEIFTFSDENFKKKCIKRLKYLLKIKKKSLICVSHEPPLLKKICSSGYIMRKGLISKKMTLKIALKQYLF
jgi:lipopolysaccharide transport system ATP-binding protein